MGHMKDFDIRIRQGGDDAIAAACELSGLAKERRGYEDTMNAKGDITDIVTVLRGVGFASVSPEAGDSASLLHYCVTHAADEIEQLRAVTRWIPVSERLPSRQWDGFSDIVVVAAGNAYFLGRYYRCDIGDECHECDADIGERWYIETTAKPTHWMPLPEPPEVK